MKKNFFITLLLLITLFSSCENGEWDFPDYEYQVVYFAYQYPVRTITLGEDIFDTTLDNEGKCMIMATLGGLYENEQNVTVDFQVDNSMVDGFVFEGSGEPVLALPSTHYTLADNRITIPNGEISGGVEVQLTDAFFADPKSIGRNYVIPIRMTNATVVDSILSGVPQVANPRRGVSTDWATQPKDFIFYAVKYINTWEGFYLRRGEDAITGSVENANFNRNEVRREQYVKDDEVVFINTLSLNRITYPISYQSSLGNNLDYKVNLNFEENNNFTISPVTAYQVNDSISVYDISASGAGEFVKDGEENSWGSQDRDALYMDYQTSFKVRTSFPNTTPARADILEEYTYVTKDTLVMRNRGVTIETFTPIAE